MCARIVKPSLLEQLWAMEVNHPHVPDTSYDSPFLRLIVSADRGRLSQSFTERNCIPGEILIREGEEEDIMFLICSGRVAIVKGDLEDPIILDFQGVGEIIGEMAILEHQPRSASVIALEDLQLLGLDRNQLELLLQETPSVSLGIMETLSTRLRRSDEARSTGELSEKRLSQQVSTLQDEKQRLEELQRLRQETTELIIHDLRNPVSAIAIALKMLTLKLPEEVLYANQELFGIAQLNCERIQRLVDSLLEVSRMEAGETQFNLSVVDLDKLIKDVISRHRILVRKGVIFETRIASELPQALIDKEIIERVLVNLTDNAAQYTPENGRILFTADRGFRIPPNSGSYQSRRNLQVINHNHLLNQSEENDYLWISVTDTGPGIPVEEHLHIFERFAQVSSDKKSRRGFGLGLTYCRLAIKRHGGNIWVEPGENGRGSCFVFTLPVRSPISKND